MPDWRQQFGRSFDVPDHVTSQLIDVSYGNDESPSFIARNQTEEEEGSGEIILPRLWVGHPNPEMRETGGARYGITYHHTTVWTGGSVTDAVDILRVITKVLDLHVEYAGCA
jgi:hypothetical protein